MNRTLQTLAAIVLVLGAGLVLWWSLIAVEEPPRKAPPRDLGPIPVEVRTVEPEAVVLDVEAYGNLEPRRRVVLTSEVSGRIVGVLERWRPGAEVEEGEVLVTLDPALYALELRAARAAVEEAEAGIARAEVELRSARLALDEAVEQHEIAEREHARLVDLGSFASDSLRDQARTTLVAAELGEETSRVQLDGASAALQAAQARAATARVAVERATETLARTEIRAPFAGRLRGEPPGLGTLAAPGSVLGELIDADGLVLMVRVPERDLVTLRRGSKAEVSFPSDPGLADLLTVGGVVTGIDAATDPVTRRGNVEIEIEVPHGGGAPDGNGADTEPASLPAGLFARARIEVGRLPGAILVARRHLAWSAGRPVVYVMRDEDGVSTAERRELVLGREHGEGFVVGAGLSAGERLIVHPLDRMRDGVEVRALDSGAGGGPR